MRQELWLNKLNRGQDYSEQEDTRVRFESDVPKGMVMVDESKLKELIRDTEFAKKVRGRITVNELRGFSGLSCHLTPPFPPRLPRPPLPPLTLCLPI